MSLELVMPSNHLILCRPLLFLPSILPSIKVFSNELALSIKWPKYWSLQTYFWVHPPRRRMEIMLTFAPILCWILLAQAPLWICIHYPSPLTLGLKIPQFCYGGARASGKIPDVLLNWLQVINPPSPALSWLCLWFNTHQQEKPVFWVTNFQNPYGSIIL